MRLLLNPLVEYKHPGQALAAPAPCSVLEGWSGGPSVIHGAFDVLYAVAILMFLLRIRAFCRSDRVQILPDRAG